MEQQRVKVEVVGVFMHQAQDAQQHFVLFRDASNRRVPMWVGQFEAWATSLALAGEVPERPFTYDAIMLCLAATRATVEEAYINDLRGETFYSVVRLRVGDQVKELDLRPSDAVNMALRAQAPIFIAERVMQASPQPKPK